MYKIRRSSHAVRAYFRCCKHTNCITFRGDLSNEGGVWKWIVKSSKSQQECINRGEPDIKAARRIQRANAASFSNKPPIQAISIMLEKEIATQAMPDLVCLQSQRRKYLSAQSASGVGFAPGLSVNTRLCCQWEAWLKARSASNKRVNELGPIEFVYHKVCC